MSEFIIRDGKNTGKIYYWMNRDIRIHDNPAFSYAQKRALEEKRDLEILFCITTDFLHASVRHYSFMLDSLAELEKECDRYGITFKMLRGDAGEVLPDYIKRAPGFIVTDFSPLKIKERWYEHIIENTDSTIIEIDSHNIVPARVVSDKQEYNARFFRKKINRILPDMIEDKYSIKKGRPLKNRNNWGEIKKWLKVHEYPGEVKWVRPGRKEAIKKYEEFLEYGLEKYSDLSNDPVEDCVSHLSVYLHYGLIGPREIAYPIYKRPKDRNTTDFLEQFIVRRELTDNYCLYNRDYDSLKGAPEWALKTLKEHQDDIREYVYSREEFEKADTHQDLWNWCQRQLLHKGYLHGYLRMFWAKKILEWSESPEQAFETTIYLNNKYFLDGRDPNGYVGVLWAIAGVHDRPWKERSVYGKIRYMNRNGCARKFNITKLLL